MLSFTSKYARGAWLGGFTLFASFWMSEGAIGLALAYFIIGLLMAALVPVKKP